MTSITNLEKAFKSDISMRMNTDKHNAPDADALDLLETQKEQQFQEFQKDILDSVIKPKLDMMKILEIDQGSSTGVSLDYLNQIENMGKTEN